MKKWKKYGNSGIQNSRCHNDSYSLVLGKRKLQSFEISHE